jgi:uncharacterized Zn finger protein (UPF0148 family)
MAACLKCGLELKAGVVLCAICGAELFLEAEVSPEETAAAIATRIRISKLYRGARSCMAE